MSKSDAIDALIESATLVFARDGFEGASLREIALNAGVALSTINLYFGTKTDLFRSVARAAWAEIDRERNALFTEAVRRHAPDPLPLPDLLYSLAYPVVRHALSDAERELAKVNLLINHLPSVEMNSGMRETADRSVARWIDAIARTCPSLSRSDVVWAFSHCVGVIYSWQLVNHRYDSLLDPGAKPTVAGVTADIVEFACAGVRAMTDRRTEAAARQAG